MQLALEMGARRERSALVEVRRQGKGCSEKARRREGEKARRREGGNSLGPLEAPQGLARFSFFLLTVVCAGACSTVCTVTCNSRHKALCAFCTHWQRRTSRPILGNVAEEVVVNELLDDSADPRPQQALAYGVVTERDLSACQQWRCLRRLARPAQGQDAGLGGQVQEQLLRRDEGPRAAAPPCPTTD